MMSPVLLVGGSGFVGRSVTARLIEHGHTVTIPTRRLVRPERVARMPKVKWVQGSVHDAPFLADLCRSLGPGGVVINLVGILHDRPGQPYGEKFKSAHVDLVRQLVEAMTAAGIRRYIHMSALGADSGGPSMYQRSKGDGEQVVRSSGLDWTIFRPSVIFGARDNFINLFSRLASRLPVLPLACSGAKFQPVSVENVAEALVRAIDMPHTVGQSYDLAGPEVWTLAQLVRFAARRAGHARPVLPLPFWVGALQARLFELLPGEPLMSRDNLASMRVDNVLPPGSDQVLDTVFGIFPEPLESLSK
ncbi:MAG: complex I NDUFA9 subunit family protein [Betaproteobacteria bacterium]|nr:complex I NDUFA9 subunit family protein [Betaproteobacteria bacterium]